MQFSGEPRANPVSVPGHGIQRYRSVLQELFWQFSQGLALFPRIPLSQACVSSMSGLEKVWKGNKSEERVKRGHEVDHA